SRTRYDDVTDGPAFTIFLGEIGNGGGSDSWAVGDRSTLRNTGSPANGGIPTPSPGGCTVNNVGNYDEKAAREAALASPIVGGLRSFHPGGGNFLFGDGSVRFLKPSTDPAIYRRLGHRADGGLVDADEM